ncbi:MAG: tetratricopeptide repeat protein, partial [Flavobacteriales bacterium]|nr:tetratricopeptide repeat protein [Flavobacteriales bacterium]
DISLALSLYQKILEQYPNDILADDALFRMAEIYDRRMSNIAKALACYQQLFLSYPGSVYVIEARKRYRILRGDKIN